MFVVVGEASISAGKESSDGRGYLRADTKEATIYDLTEYWATVTTVMEYTEDTEVETEDT